MKINKFYFLFLMILFSSCLAQTNKKEKINTKINKDYFASRKSFYGKLNPDEYKQIRELITSELKTQIADNYAILINYKQLGTNCFEFGLNDKNALKVIDKGIEISSRLSSTFNAKDFFVYSADALNRERIETRKKYILDSGFFQKNIFTLQENCSAFFILKPNGEFMKYYGGDYYSEVEYFLQKND